ncbi:MAM and LDL-receptor class A domain-containing protein 1-like [Antedon mediterranea]|uniref:MAM and LDL-receptor class A domain-containing protein 1-like n=1 Tax=Antedon mediterranea TaxID=105859 RepID=UPI003AF68050
MDRRLKLVLLVAVSGALANVSTDTSNPSVMSYNDTVNCDFDLGLCGYTQDTDDEFDWTRRNRPTGTVDTGPPADHTTGNGTGYYMYIETSSPIKKHWSARLKSPMVDGPRSNSCLQFYYHMYGLRIGTLNVIMTKTANDVQVIWTKSGDKGNRWFQGLVDIPMMTDDFRITFEGIRGEGIYADIAIDDIKLLNESCFIGHSCDFEADRCLDQVTNDDFNWRRISGSTGSTNTGPSTDHTTGTSAGFYIYVETSAPRRPKEVAKISTPRIRTGSAACLTFWYHMYGVHVDTLNVVVNSTQGDISNKIWSKTGNRGNVWRPAEVTINDVGDDYKVIFEGIVGISFQGDIAIDDVTVADYSCTSSNNGTSNVVIGISCTFEEPEICGYTQDTSDDFNWIWQNYATGTLGTGPSSDHTLGTGLGFYVFIETSLPNKLGDTARLISPYQNSTVSSYCVEFWYHMYGPTVEELKVFLKYKGETLSNKITDLEGNFGDYWHRETVVIQPTKQFAIVFEGMAGEARFGDIAIDDVHIYEQTCPTLITTPLPPTDPPTVYDDGNCNFEDGWCDYTQEIYDDFDWSRKRGSTSSFGTGPSTDHTYNNATGYYIYIETSIQSYDARARLYSPLIAKSANSMCVQFWCHMFGNTVDFLNIYVMNRKNEYILPIDALLSVYGDHGDKWFSQQFEVKPTTDNFYIVFEGIQGKSFTGDIAIDDIQFTRSACPPTTSPPVLLESFCDFDFGYEPCGYTQETENDQFDWTLTYGETPSDGTGPTNDHTRGNELGRYIYIESSQPRRPLETAVIRSPTMDGTATVPCLQFWYHMYGMNVGTLTVFKEEPGFEPTRLWWRGGDQGNEWIEAKINIPPYSYFQVSFEASVGSQHSDIALDDIRVSPHPCGTHLATPTPAQQIGEEKCDFENGPDACGIVQLEDTDQFDWEYFDAKHHFGITDLPSK